MGCVEAAHAVRLKPSRNAQASQRRCRADTRCIPTSRARILRSDPVCEILSNNSQASNLRQSLSGVFEIDLDSRYPVISDDLRAGCGPRAVSRDPSLGRDSRALAASEIGTRPPAGRAQLLILHRGARELAASAKH